MAQRGYRVSGIERHLLHPGDNAPSIEGATLYDMTAEECELPRHAFDFIYAIHVIEHFTDPAAVFKAIAASLRSGGMFYCITPNAESYGLSVFRRHWWNLEDPTHYRFFSRRSLTSMLHTAGFGVVRTQIVLEDSLTLEVNSALRKFSLGDPAHGILQTPAAVVAGFGAPFAMLARLCVPRLSPSFEAIGVMG
jgi:2-polyprenyl-3-methyl-5-hydroxy-6-metoxy-1,4-benzoquinol methylase